MKVAVVLVHYRTPELVAPAWSALVRDAATSGVELEGALVDNSGGAVVPDPALRLVAPGSNLGYAGGVNLGMRATTAPLVVVMNPDVLVERGCLGALAAALHDGAGAAGPRFVWDDAHRFLLPPNERRDAASELLAALARRGRRWAALARRRWRRHARRHWQATAPLASRELSGALLALRRDAWERVGPFDEGYSLYFEEVDWLDRLAAAGGRSRYVPGAVAVHLHARSALEEPRAGEWFEASSRRYRRRAHGRAFARLLERLAASPGPVAPPSPGRGRLETTEGPAGPILVRLPAATAWLEVSPRVEGFPAAAAPRPPSPGEPVFPRDLWGRLTPGDWNLRPVDARGRELATAGFTVPPARPSDR